MSETIIYAVWIKGQGWLKLDGDKERTFLSLQKEVAQTAATLWGKDAIVMPWDKTLLLFEATFLQHQHFRWPLWRFTTTSR